MVPSNVPPNLTMRTRQKKANGSMVCLLRPCGDQRVADILGEGGIGVRAVRVQGFGFFLASAR